MGRCARLGVGAAVAAAAVAVGVVVYVALGGGDVPSPLGPEAPSGLFADGFGFVALGFGLLVALVASALPRLGRSVRTVGARLGVGAACVAGVGVGVWALGAGALIPVVLRPGAFGTLWALLLAGAGATLLGASVAGLCAVLRRRGGRPQTMLRGA